MNTMHMDTMLLAVGEPSVDPAISLGSLVVGGIISVIALAIFIWAIVRVIQLRDVDVYGLPWVAWLLIVLLTGGIGQIVFLILSYLHEKKQKEAAANGYYFDGHYYWPYPQAGDATNAAPYAPTAPNAPAGAAPGMPFRGGMTVPGAPTVTPPYARPSYPGNPASSFNQKDQAGRADNTGAESGSDDHDGGDDSSSSSSSSSSADK